MDACQRFERVLHRLAAPAPPIAPKDAERRAAELAALAHAARCERCALLLRIARGDTSAVPAPPGDLAGAILARTSGVPCRRAAELMSAESDSGIDPEQRLLLEAHVARCVPCGQLRAVLRAQREELAAWAEIPPDERFVAEVLLATTGRDSASVSQLRASRAIGRRPAWDESVWARLLRRRRIALEIGYAASFALFLVFGTPKSPLREVPPQALAVARVNPVASLADLFDPSPVRSVEGWVSGLRHRPSPAPVLSSAAEQEGFARRVLRMLEILDFSLDRAGGMWSALLQGDFGRVAALFESLRAEWGGDAPSESRGKGVEPRDRPVRLPGSVSSATQDSLRSEPPNPPEVDEPLEESWIP